MSPGTDAFGTWTQLDASTDRKHRYWACVLDQLADVSEGDFTGLVQIGVGPDSSNVSVVHVGSYIEDNSEVMTTPFPLLSFGEVIAAQPIWARIAGGSTEARGVIAYGID